MRRKGHFFRILLTAVLLLGLLPLNIWAAEGQSAGEATVLFTHDLHSCFFPRVQEGGEERGGFARLAAALDAMSPLKVLSRGYAIPRREDGAVVRSVREAAAGDRLELQLSDGKLDCEVQ